MFSSITKALSIFKNLGKITEISQTVYNAVSKLLVALNFIQSETNSTKLGKTLEKYLPPTIMILEKVKTLLEKYGSLVNLDVKAAAQSTNISESSLLEELESSAKELNKLL